ncbi:hypothetical protein QYF61_014886 [Mycteria americana]|uniref:Separase n=1 Tax=Mycteria americana TaxID=33587 RepID=A0AAN7N3A2_MYCAM|nr:hypothetical protein QYF61_014886 [Mycteria americana]
MESWEDTDKLLAELRVSRGLGGSAAGTAGDNPPLEGPGLGAGGLTPSRPQECLFCFQGDASGTSQASRLRKSQVCDRVLRICVERMAEPGDCPALATSLVTVAEEACQGYLTAVPQPAPLYLEKILYHLLRNVAGWGSGDACWRVANLLRARLLSYRPGQAPSKDFTAIAHSSFSVLWRGADALAEPDRPQEEGRAVLSVRLRALRFLLLLEEDGAALLPLQPPFFTSRTAQQAAAAAALYEAQRAPSSAFLGQQLKDSLLAALQKEATEPPTLQQSLCFFELTLEQCRHLCRGGRYREAEEAVKDARSFLGATGSSAKSFSDPLSLLEAGIQLSRVLAKSAWPAGPPLSQAAAALGTVASERFLRVLAESCQFIVSSLSEYVKRSKQQPFGREDVLGLCAFTEGHYHVLQQLLERFPPDAVKQKLVVKQLLYCSLQLFASVAYDAFQCSQVLAVEGMVPSTGQDPRDAGWLLLLEAACWWVWKGLLKLPWGGFWGGCGVPSGLLPATLSLSPNPLQMAGWPGLEQLTAGCRRSVAWMLEALEGLGSERAKYLDITGQCHGSTGVVGATKPGSLGRTRSQSSTSVYPGSNEGVLCHAKYVAGGAGVEGDCPWLDKEEESFSLHRVFNSWVLLAAVSCTFKLAYIFYNQNLYEEASFICELFCKKPQAADAYACPEIPPERLHKCFRLQVESCRKLGRLERALVCVVQWLAALRGRIGELLAEPVSLWVRVKMDAAKQGAEELRLRTLKEGLEGHSLDMETLVTVLFAELKAYKTIRADTGQERYNVLCDLLEICSEESGRLHERAIGLTELAQVLCYHSYAQQTDWWVDAGMPGSPPCVPESPQGAFEGPRGVLRIWSVIALVVGSVWGPGVYLSLPVKCSTGFGGGQRLFLIRLSGSSSLDSVREALRLLDLVPRSAQNRDRLLDDQAQALLWLYICTLESKLEKSIERDQRAKAQGLKNLDDFEPNDLNYEGRLLEDRFLYDSISFNLATETGEDACGFGPFVKRLSRSAWFRVRVSQTCCVPSALSKSLDDAFTLWKQLVAMPGVPAVRSPEQTVASLHLLAALYKLMAKPFQAMESYLLVRDLCSVLGDSLGMAGALCQVTKLLFQLECPSYAQLFLEETESCLQKADSSHDSYLLLQQTCLLLRSQLCCVNHQIEKGLGLLLGVLQNPAMQKITKVWYLLRAHVLQLVAVYLSLPRACLLPELQQWIFVQGWKTPETALAEAHKLFRSIILLLMGSDVLGCQTAASDVQFVDYGDNLLLKWQVLADMLACSEQLVALLSRLEVVCKAKAFCLEAVKLAMKLQASRWCTSFLVLKAQLELQQSELELSHFDLQQALFLLESDAELKDSKKQKGQTKILPRKGKREGKKPRDPVSELPGEEEGFLKGPALEFVAPVSGLEKVDALTASPELKPEKRKRLAFLTHPAACTCCLCSDLALSALCLRWLLSCAQGELAAGSAAEGLGLIRAVLLRCTAVATRFAPVLRDKLWGGSVGRDLPALELLNDLVATGYATLALQSLASSQPVEELQEELETGLTFIASCRPHLPSLEFSRASLLLAKAMATVYRLPCKRGNSLDGVFTGSWTSQLPTPTPAEPEVAAVPQTFKTDKAQPQRRKNKTALAPAVPKPRVKKSQRAKPLAVANTNDVFALGDSDSEVPPIVIRPVTVPCTPHQKACPPAKTHVAPGTRTPFTIFSESSPPAGKSRLLRAPRVLGRVKTRLKVTFSDDSDVEDPKVGLTPTATCKTSSTRKALPPKSTGSQASLLGFGGQSSGARPQRGRPGTRRAGAAKENRERVTRRAPSKRAEEEQELLRAIEEEEMMEKELEISFEVLRASEEEEGAPGRRRLPRRRQEGAGGKQEVLQQEAGEDVLAAQWPGSGDHPHPEGTLSSTQPTAGESENGLGWKGPLKLIQSNRPAMSRDSFNQSRLLRAPSSLALNVSRDGASTSSLGNPGQCLTTLSVKPFFLISSLNLPSFSLKPLPLVLSLQALLKSPSLSFL